MLTRTVARLALVTGMLGGLGWLSGPAAAAPTVTVTAEVRVGNSGTLGGTATFSRTLQADGTEVLTAQAHLLRTSVESSLCLSHHEFTRRQAWDNCPNKTEQTTEVSYTLNLGTEYVGSVVHIQFRVRMPEFPNKPGLANGYAGWRAPQPPPGQRIDQYGEVAVPPLAITPSPSTTPPSTTPPSTTPPSTTPPSTTPPTGVNAGSGGGAAPGWPVVPSVLMLAGLGLAAEAGRRLARGR